jgi:hypothetical protein
LRAEGLAWAHIARRFMEDKEAGRLVAMRWAHGWSQWDVASRWNALWPPKGGTAGINDKHISNWENWAPGNPYEYTVEPSLQTLRRLARIYECDVADLAEDLSYSHLDEAARNGDRPEHPVPWEDPPAGKGNAGTGTGTGRATREGDPRENPPAENGNAYNGSADTGVRIISIPGGLPVIIEIGGAAARLPDSPPRGSRGRPRARSGSRTRWTAGSRRRRPADGNVPGKGR